jgi:hypothetical protein
VALGSFPVVVEKKGVRNGAEVVAENPSGLHSNPLVITSLARRLLSQ